MSGPRCTFKLTSRHDIEGTCMSNPVHNIYIYIYFFFFFVIWKILNMILLKCQFLASHVYLTICLCHIYCFFFFFLYMKSGY